MLIENFTVLELSIALVSIIGAIAVCLKSSRCSEISSPCCHIKRIVIDEIEKTNKEDNEEEQ